MKLDVLKKIKESKRVLQTEETDEKLKSTKTICIYEAKTNGLSKKAKIKLRI